MAEKKNVTLMLLKVDLECSKCYKKVKKILCKFPQIQDQVYDEKNNTVMIKVVCCSPEKIRDKICCKGRGTIKSIEILKPPEKPPAPKPAEKPPAPKPGKKPTSKNTAGSSGTGDDPPITDKPPPTRPTKAVNFFDVPKTCYINPPVPIGFFCTECSEGRGGGPCYNPCGRPVYGSCGGGGYIGNYGSRCSEYYFNEDNSQGCTIM